LFIGTPRLLAQEGYVEFSSDQKLSEYPGYSVPTGFQLIVPTIPLGLGDVLAELNALCHILDDAGGSHDALLNDHFRFENFQYCIQSRSIDLWSETKSSGIQDPIYEACIFTTFLCAYMLSVGIWEGCFIPDYCAIRVLDLIMQAQNDPRLRHWRELLLWLLVVTGALTRRTVVRAKALMMIRTSFQDVLYGLYEDWEQLAATLKTFVWSNYAMERDVRWFWEELREL
jgi:hypothetical protein